MKSACAGQRRSTPTLRERSARRGVCTAATTRSPIAYLSVRDDGVVENFPTGKIKPTEIDKGDGFTVETAGGGGFWRGHWSRGPGEKSAR